MLIVLYFYISTLWCVCVRVCVCAVHNMCVFCISFISCIYGMLLRYFLDDFVMVPAPLLLLVSRLFTIILLLLLALALAFLMQRHKTRYEMKRHKISWCSRLWLSPSFCSSVLASFSAVLRVSLLLCTHKTGLY